ncbi:hypothetical protein A2V49_01305 [candidate division WWE3 bacterium RBG_19FT_COMBO_34_6]|uniref:Uncharacterized protein n=1 Tax=candidate division WWE3 bacterium RBG_19FT_COMBO_34_6 TaxID=1802612 RepID=A0A1F4ULZ6_UNCKA|nr:MAG: hypothetical protein A2V49_01305 [candidate division WWE3 bacterium RBG_19FT_COMBO_34_6]
MNQIALVIYSIILLVISALVIMVCIKRYLGDKGKRDNKFLILVILWCIIFLSNLIILGMIVYLYPS